MAEMYDIAIVGAGPAGISAAIYAARNKLKTIVLTKNIGGMAMWSGEVQNFAGYPVISGSELVKKFEEHLRSFEIEIKTDVEVTCMQKVNDRFMIEAIEEGVKKTYEALTVVMATGRIPKSLGVKGEREYKNKGITYCATCDGPLFAKKDVAIIGGGNSALDATMQMMKIAKKIYLITKEDKILGEQVMIDKAKEAGNVEIITKADTKGFFGEKFLKGIKLIVGGKEKVLDVEGAFIEIGSSPVVDPSKCANVNANDKAEIIVDEKCNTNVPGLFAAGDVTNVPEKQIIVAAGHGCIASMQAFKYIASRRN